MIITVCRDRSPRVRSDLVVCTALDSRVYHVRRLDSRYPFRPGGHPRPLPMALCSQLIDRDSSQPLVPARIGCRDCRERLVTA